MINWVEAQLNSRRVNAHEIEVVRVFMTVFNGISIKTLSNGQGLFGCFVDSNYCVHVQLSALNVKKQIIRSIRFSKLILESDLFIYFLMKRVRWACADSIDAGFSFTGQIQSHVFTESSKFKMLEKPSVLW